jgi:LysM repeat protein
MSYAPPPAYSQTGTLGYSRPTPPSYERPPAGYPYGQQPYERRNEPSYLQTGSLGNTREPARAPYSSNRWSDSANPTGPIQPVPPVDNPNPMRWHAGSRPAPGSIPPHAIPPDSQIIQVREGDTIYGLARKYRVPVAELVSVNRIYGGRLEVGQKLAVPADPK